jgi:hypothetical protein
VLSDGGSVEQQDVLDLALEHASLQAGTNGHDLVWVHALVRLLAAGQLLDQVDDGGHPGRAADEHHVGDFAQLDAGVLDHLLERALAPVKQVRGHLLELGPAQLGVQVQRSLLGVRDVGQIDLDSVERIDLCLPGLTESLQPSCRPTVDAIAVLES